MHRRRVLVLLQLCERPEISETRAAEAVVLNCVEGVCESGSLERKRGDSAKDAPRNEDELPFLVIRVESISSIDLCGRYTVKASL